jgi:pyruvate,water dikinase
MIKLAVPPQLRHSMLEKIPAKWHEEALNAPFDFNRYIESFQGVEKNRPDMGLNWWRAIRDDFINNEKYRDDTKPLSPAELGELSNHDLKHYIGKVVRLEVASYDPPWNGLLWHMREALGWINWMIENWYDGDRTHLFMDLVTGTRESTITTIENHRVWMLADFIHKSPELKSLLECFPNEGFFDYLEQCIDGPEFKKMHEEHMRLGGHRGHPDRDILFDRRADRPSMDVAMFKSLMGTPDPLLQEHLMREKLEQTIQHMFDNLLVQENGLIRSQAFKFLVDFAHNSIKFRDDEREVMDWSTYAIKLGYEEISRRCVEQGRLDCVRDGYFLTQDELYQVLDGRANMPLAAAKITARRKNFYLIDSKEKHPSKYLQAGLPANVDAAIEHGEGVLTGKTTSLGKVTGIARVVRELSQIGTVNKGEILIVHATDPGWTPVFMMITGIVLETGGLISHGALLAREYGLPGVQIPGALELIPDGATITLDGDAGMVIIHDEENPAVAAIA